jgi:hypothetical protein
MYKTTHEILKMLCGRDRQDCFEPLSGLPEFDPEKHSDGCSGGMSAAYAKLPDWVHERFGQSLPWRHCCIEHDRAYYYGGSREEKIAADLRLKECVADTVGNKLTGELLGNAMRLAVHIGGQPYFSTPYRWGYGEDFRDAEDLPAK